jgi:hypothetical protein
MSKQQKGQKGNKQNHKPKTTGVKIGEAVGGILGGLVGQKQIGRDAGAWLARITGLGAYKLHQNSFSRSSEDVPVFEYNGDGSVIITHKEYVTDIKGSAAFTSTDMDLVPTNPIPFPWLTIEALGYDQYEFLGLVACYNPLSGDAIASTNNTLGSVTISTEYDVSRMPFASKKEMAEYMFTTSKKPDEFQIHPIECNPKKDIVNARYLGSVYRTSAAATGSSSAATGGASNIAENLRSLGRLTIATQGQQAVTTIGELWLTYKVKLSKPRIPPNGFPHGMFHASNAGTIVSGSGHFDTPLVMADSTLFANMVGIPSSQTIDFGSQQAGTLVLVHYMAKSISGTSPTITIQSPTLTSCSYVTHFFNGSANTTSEVITGTGTSLITYTSSFRLTDLNAKIVFNLPTVGGTTPVFSWELSVWSYPERTPHTNTPVLSLKDFDDEKFVVL